MSRPPQLRYRLGRVKRAARRLFLLSDEITTSRLRSAAYPLRRRIPKGNYNRLRDVLDGMAVRVRRVPPYGAWLWRVREEGGSTDGSAEQPTADKSLLPKEK
jgi:hypothetical protein